MNDFIAVPPNTEIGCKSILPKQNPRPSLNEGLLPSKSSEVYSAAFFFVNVCVAWP